MKYNTIKMEDALETIIDYRGKTPHKSDAGIITLSAKSVKNNYGNTAQLTPHCHKKSDIL